MAGGAAPAIKTDSQPTGKLSFGEMFRTADGRNNLFTFLLVCTLFGLWGFSNGQLDTLNKHFQHSLKISIVGSTLVQFSTFIGYAFMALPAGSLIRRFGYKGGIIIGLGLMATGAFWFYPAVAIGQYWAFLAGLFVIACGLACLETAANPYTTVLGPPQGAAARINLAQSTNGIGVLLGPIVGSMFYLSRTGVPNISNEKLWQPYVGIAAVVTVLAVIFALSKVPEPPAEEKVAGGGGSLLAKKHFVFAVLAQFFYVGAQIAIWGLFINFLTSEAEMPGFGSGLANLLPGDWTFHQGEHYRLTDYGAGWMFALGGFGLFSVGRLTGSMALRVFSAQKTLALYGLMNVIMMALVFARLGWLSVAALFLSNLFMSIMFPTIFSLGIQDLGDQTKRASSFIVMSIGGGAVFPILNGWISGHFGLARGFIVPLFCFLAVMLYALSWQKLHAESTKA
jgi:FHS family L-fucose permease-like MFS transporter